MVDERGVLNILAAREKERKVRKRRMKRQLCRNIVIVVLSLSHTVENAPGQHDHHMRARGRADLITQRGFGEGRHGPSAQVGPPSCSALKLLQAENSWA